VTVLFISDIHLSPERPEIFRAFSKFLSEHAKDVSALYVLGDLFDAWIGDDDPSDLAANTKKALREISDAGVELFIQRGNRDFTIGRKFSKDVRGTIIKDEHIVSSGQQSALVIMEIHSVPMTLIINDLEGSREIRYIGGALSICH
jgi:UDP-2,3-diacylglucosamine hydrolase